MPGIKLNTGLPASIVDALALRGGRAEYEQALRLLSDVVPVVVLAGGEQASTGGGTTTESQGFMRAHALTAGPGLAPLVQLSNPVGSNVNLLLDALSWQTAAAGLVHLRRNSPAVIGAVAAVLLVGSVQYMAEVFAVDVGWHVVAAENLSNSLD